MNRCQCCHRCCRPGLLLSQLASSCLPQANPVTFRFWLISIRVALSCAAAVAVVATTICSAGKFTLREAGAIRFDSVFDEYVRYISPECHEVCVAPQLQCCCSTRRDFSTTITNIYCLLIAQCCCCCSVAAVVVAGVMSLFGHTFYTATAAAQLTHTNALSTLFPLDVRSPSLSLPRSFSFSLRLCVCVLRYVALYLYIHMHIYIFNLNIQHL